MATGAWPFLHEWVIYIYLSSRGDERTLGLKQVVSSTPPQQPNKSPYQLFFVGLIEAWGRGTLRIISERKQSGLPAPTFFAEGSDIAVELKSSRPGTVEKTTDHILALIARDPQITTSSLAKITGLSRRGIEHNLKKLKTEGRIVRIGPDKGGRWIINTSGG